MPLGGAAARRMKLAELTDAGRSAPPLSADWYPGRLCLMLVLVAGPVFALDQLSKLYVSHQLAPYQRIVLIPHWLAITYALNPGAAFSMFATVSSGVRNLVLSTLAAGAIVLLAILIARGARPMPVTVAFALIMAGAAGNLVDRLVRGRVIDFIYVHYYAWSYPVFNVADSAITIGVAIILVFSIFQHDHQG
jgi:signal peptidase II